MIIPLMMCDRLPWPRLVPRTSYGIKRSTPGTPEHGRIQKTLGILCVPSCLCVGGWGKKAGRARRRNDFKWV